MHVARLSALWQDTNHHGIQSSAGICFVLNNDTSITQDRMSVEGHIIKDYVPIVSMEGICKRFPGVVALDQADFELRSGEVHALLGENGAGKSTLMKILSGLYHPDSGKIMVRGQKVSINSPNEAIELQIGMVYQSFKLVSELTVLENIVLGDPTLPFWFNSGKIEGRISDIIKQYGLQVDPRAKIWQLSVGEQQRVEIIKLFHRGADILILDEPTSVLTPQETETLLKMVKAFIGEGHSVIFISHKLHEVLKISDRVTVFRKGKKIGTVETNKTDQRELTRMMVGREVLLKVKKEQHSIGRTVIEVKNLSALNDKRLPALDRVSFNLRKSEIFGLAGISGNGQRELAEVLTGLRPATSGSITLDGREILGMSILQIIKEGISLIPEKRLGRGLVPGFTVGENLVLKSYRDKQFSYGYFLRQKRIGENSQRLIRKFSIKAPKTKNYVRLLSGGNVQKVILAREITGNPRVIVASRPTYGLDVGAIEFVQQALELQKEKGAAILLISEELDELLRLSDRIAVMFKGRIVKILPSDQADIETIGMLMTGGDETREHQV